MYDLDGTDYVVKTLFIGNEYDLREWTARDRFNCEDHGAHVQAGWDHHYATAHIEPHEDLPF